MIYDASLIVDGKIFTNGRGGYRKILRNSPSWVYYSVCDENGIPKKKSESCNFSNFMNWAINEKETIKPGDIFTNGSGFSCDRLVSQVSRCGQIIYYYFVDDRGKRVSWRGATGGECSERHFSRWGYKKIHNGG